MSKINAQLKDLMSKTFTQKSYHYAPKVNTNIKECNDFENTMSSLQKPQTQNKRNSHHKFLSTAPQKNYLELITPLNQFSYTRSKPDQKISRKLTYMNKILNPDILTNESYRNRPMCDLYKSELTINRNEITMPSSTFKTMTSPWCKHVRKNSEAFDKKKKKFGFKTDITEIEDKKRSTLINKNTTLRGRIETENYLNDLNPYRRVTNKKSAYHF